MLKRIYYAYIRNAIQGQIPHQNVATFLWHSFYPFSDYTITLYSNAIKF